jgi:hypothetical protein
VAAGAPRRALAGVPRFDVLDTSQGE